MTVLDNLMIGYHLHVEYNSFAAALGTRSVRECERKLREEMLEFLAFIGLAKFGTDSGKGSIHAALASLHNPPREIRQRVWSAQVSVLLPLIDARRLEIVTENRGLLAAHLRGAGRASDPLDLQIGDLMSPVLRRVLDRKVHDQVERLVRWRNALAHLKPLPLSAARALAGS